MLAHTISLYFGIHFKEAVGIHFIPFKYMIVPFNQADREEFISNFIKKLRRKCWDSSKLLDKTGSLGYSYISISEIIYRLVLCIERR